MMLLGSAAWNMLMGKVILECFMLVFETQYYVFGHGVIF